MDKLHDNDKIQFHGHPDDLGRICYTVFWLADYHPGHPKGEYRTGWRGQVFFSVPPAHTKNQEIEKKFGISES